MPKDKYEVTRKAFRWVALVLALVSALMTFKFGIHQSSDPIISWALAIGLPGAAFASAYAWPMISEEVRRVGWRASAIPLAIGVLVTGTDITTNFGSIAWQRLTNVSDSNIKNIRYDDARTSIKDNTALRAEFKTSRALLVERNEWAGTVTAVSLRGQLPAIDEKIKQEAANIRCGPLCLRYKQQRAALMDKIGKVEKIENLDKRIAAIDRVLAGMRSKSATLEKPVSAIDSQNVSLASMVSLSREPTENAKHWTDKGVAWLIAAFFTFGAMGCNYFGFGSRSPDPEPNREGTPADSTNWQNILANAGLADGAPALAQQMQDVKQARSAPVQPGTTVQVIGNRMDDEAMRKMISRVKGAVNRAVDIYDGQKVAA